MSRTCSRYWTCVFCRHEPRACRTLYWKQWRWAAPSWQQTRVARGNWWLTAKRASWFRFETPNQWRSGSWSWYGIQNDVARWEEKVADASSNNLVARA